MSAYISIHQHTPAYVSIRQHTWPEALRLMKRNNAGVIRDDRAVLEALACAGEFIEEVWGS